MASRTTATVFRHVGEALRLADERGTTDGQLLTRFLEAGDEQAFGVLVRRHGPMIWSVCRRALNHHDAEEVFQATFLVLARKGNSVQPRELVAPWLYGVARQACLQARRTSARRRSHERQVRAVPH